jgi:hypothetical protein
MSAEIGSGAASAAAAMDSAMMAYGCVGSGDCALGDGATSGSSTSRGLRVSSSQAGPSPLE